MPLKELLVDPAVSRAKFERQLAEYRKLEGEYRKRGWWLLDAVYPEVFIIFGTPKLKPPSVAFGALLDFTNYDLWPPSVRLVDPFTREPYAFKDLPTKLPRRIAGVTPPELAAHGIRIDDGEQPMMQAHDPGDIPFLCLAGVREYHEHPAHTGDSWLLHRAQGEGTLHFILDQLYKYGVDPIKAYRAELRIAVSGYQGEAPP